MAVRFVVGRAGSGKTWRCIEQIAERLRGNAAEGPRLLMIVPDQASFQVERAIIEQPGITAFTRCEVLSFRRLAFRIFADTGADPRLSDQTMGPLGRLMLMRRLVRRNRSSLTVLARVADKAGLIAALAKTIDELMREQVDPQALVTVAEQRRENDPLGAARLADTACLYRAYLESLQEGRIDPAQYLTMAAERAGRCPWLNGAEMWVDGFAGFTQQEHILLAEVARRAAAVEVTMLLEPQASALTANELPRLSYSRFARTERTLVRLRREFTSRGLALDEPIRLEGLGRRFKPDALARLESRLFADQPAGPPAEPVSAGVIRVLELPDRRAEVQYAVTEIQRLVREAELRMRYREIAVIVRDLAAYHDLLSAAMSAAQIPCFIDRRQPTTHHPLVELVRGLLELAVNNCPPEAVRRLLKTGLLRYTSDTADRLENFLLAEGLKGRQAWAQPWIGLNYFGCREPADLNPSHRRELNWLNAARLKWNERLGPWLDEALPGRQASGRQWAAWLFECLTRLKVGHVLQRWAEQAQADGRGDLADSHRQVWQDFIKLLDECVQGLGGEQLTIPEFAEAIEAGLGAFDLGLAPPTLDQVLVGSIERSRQPALRAALILGFDESQYPSRKGEDPLLGDNEREALAGQGVQVGATRAQRLGDDRMLAYIALTRASERLWISYPRKSDDGKALGPSSYLQEVLSAAEGLSVEAPADPRGARTLGPVNGVGQAAASLAAELRARGPREGDSNAERRAWWNRLYDQLRSHREWEASVSLGLSGLRYRNQVAAPDPELLARLYGDSPAFSVSELEAFAACPFQHFTRFVLGLKPRPELEIAPAALGTLCHDVLERFVRDLIYERRGLSELEDDDIHRRLDGIIRQTLGSAVYQADERAKYLARASGEQVKRLGRWMRNFARQGRLRPWAAEMSFGRDRLIELRTPDGRRFRLRGRIDRVDLADLGGELAAAVFDYKRTEEKHLKYPYLLHGLTLQLTTYLVALEALGESPGGRPIRPIAALYQPLLPQYEKVKHPGEASEGDETLCYTCRGLVSFEDAELLDARITDDRESAFFSGGITGKGEPYQSSDLLTSADLGVVLDHTRRKLGALAAGAMDGVRSVFPYRISRQGPCGYCDGQAVCRFEAQWQPANELSSCGRGQALALMSDAAKADRKGAADA